MSANVKRVKGTQEYAEVRISKDGRRYVTVSDVLNSPAGRAEIRKNAETFERLSRDSHTNQPRIEQRTTGTTGTAAMGRAMSETTSQATSATTGTGTGTSTGTSAQAAGEIPPRARAVDASRKR